MLKPLQISQFRRGLRTDIPLTALALGACATVSNMIFDRGSLRVRPGIRRAYTPIMSSTNEGIRALAEYTNVDLGYGQFPIFSITAEQTGSYITATATIQNVWFTSELGMTIAGASPSWLNGSYACWPLNSTEFVYYPTWTPDTLTVPFTLTVPGSPPTVYHVTAATASLTSSGIRVDVTVTENVPNSMSCTIAGTTPTCYNGTGIEVYNTGSNPHAAYYEIPFPSTPGIGANITYTYRIPYRLLALSGSYLYFSGDDQTFLTPYQVPGTYPGTMRLAQYNDTMFFVSQLGLSQNPVYMTLFDPTDIAQVQPVGYNDLTPSLQIGLSQTTGGNLPIPPNSGLIYFAYTYAQIQADSSYVESKIVSTVINSITLAVAGQQVICSVIEEPGLTPNDNIYIYACVDDTIFTDTARNTWYRVAEMACTGVSSPTGSPVSINSITAASDHTYYFWAHNYIYGPITATAKCPPHGFSSPFVATITDTNVGSPYAKSSVICTPTSTTTFTYILNPSTGIVTVPASETVNVAYTTSGDECNVTDLAYDEFVYAPVPMRPPLGCTNLCSFNGRMYYTLNDTLYYSNQGAADVVPNSSVAFASASTGGYVQIGNDGGAITALKAFGSYLHVFKQRGIWRMVGDPGDQGAAIEQISFERGAIAQETVCSAEGTVLMWAERNSVWAFDGNVFFEIGRPIAALWKAVDPSFQTISHMAYDPTMRQVLLQVHPVSEQAGVLSSTIYVCDMAEPIGRLEEDPTTPLYSWSMYSGMPGGCLKTLAYAPVPGVYAGDPTGVVVNVGTPPVAWFYTGIWLLNDPTQQTDDGYDTTGIPISFSWQSGLVQTPSPNMYKQVKRIDAAFGTESDEVFSTVPVFSLYLDKKNTPAVSRSLTPDIDGNVIWYPATTEDFRGVELNIHSGIYGSISGGEIVAIALSLQGRGGKR
jgi:hypothetical protein